MTTTIAILAALTLATLPLTVWLVCYVGVITRRLDAMQKDYRQLVRNIVTLHQAGERTHGTVGKILGSVGNVRACVAEMDRRVERIERAWKADFEERERWRDGRPEDEP